MNLKQMIPIEDPKDERIAVYTKYHEPQLLHYYEPNPGIFIAETPMIIERALEKGLKPLSFFLEEEAWEKEDVQRVLSRISFGPKEEEEEENLAVDACKASDVPIYVASHALMRQITGYELTRGML
ncbi:MAG: RNA methyltransferase, partial [Lachnospiraceae bacterium]|nr:RNA methyltransferase [Lachnospiraceae bacterium]